MPSPTSADPMTATKTTLLMLAERLPGLSRITFPALWAAVAHLDGILDRPAFYRLLLTLDGAHLTNSGHLVRVINHERASRRALVITPLRTWPQQREYLHRYLARGHRHPLPPITYSEAHRRVRAARGPASADACDDCGEPAAEWSYAGASPDEQTGMVRMAGGDEVRAWSPVPTDYDPVCRRCHRERDAYGIGGDYVPVAVALRQPPLDRAAALVSAARDLRDLAPVVQPLVGGSHRLAAAWAAMDAAGESPVGLPDDAPTWLRHQLGAYPANPRLVTITARALVGATWPPPRA